MQIRLTPETIALANEFVELCKKVAPTYSTSLANLCNQVLQDKLGEEIRRMKKKGVK